MMFNLHFARAFFIITAFPRSASEEPALEVGDYYCVICCLLTANGSQDKIKTHLHLWLPFSGITALLAPCSLHPPYSYFVLHPFPLS